MGKILTFPTVIEHKLTSSGALTGVEPDGLDSEETLFRGRYRVYSECAAAGLIHFDSSLTTGFKVERASWSLTGLTGVDFYIVDPDGDSCFVGSTAGANGHFEWRHGGVLVPPTFDFKAVATGGAISAAGMIIFSLGVGWGNTTFGSVATMGRQAYPPSQFK